MSNLTLFFIVVIAFFGALACSMIGAYLERRTARVFLEAFDLMRPAMEDLRRIEPHLDEAIELALIRVAAAQEDMRRIANGYVTPLGLVRARKRKG